jgi:hypothetical protein
MLTGLKRNTNKTNRNMIENQRVNESRRFNAIIARGFVWWYR